MKTGHMEKMGMDQKPVRIYPNISISEKDFPDVKNWKLDDTVELCIKCKVTSVERSRWSADKKATASVDIVDMRKEDKKESYGDEYARKMNRAADKM